MRVQVIQSDTLNPDNLYKKFCSNDCLTPDDYSEAAVRAARIGQYSGTGFRINYTHNERDWFFRLGHRSNGKNLRSDLGFMPRADWNISVIGGGYRWYNSDQTSWWNKVTLSGDWDVQRNDAGELLEREVEAHLNIEGMLQSEWSFGVVSRERVGDRQQKNTLSVASSDLFDEGFIYNNIEIRPFPELLLKTSVRKGKQIDFANNRLGDHWRVFAEAQLSLGRHMQLNMRHTHNDLDAGGKALFTAKLTDLRLSYQFDQRQFLRAILIHSDISRNTTNYLVTNVQPHSRSLSAQLLYSYKLNPLTKFFIGYSSGAIENADIPQLKDNEQSVFLKLSYAWLG